MRPLWRMLRVWGQMVPSEFRRPVPVDIALSMATLALMQGKVRIAVLILISHHGLLRPSEARAVCWKDFAFMDPEHNPYPNVFGVINITQSKTRRLRSHATHQYVTIESKILAEFLQTVVASLAPGRLHERVWPVAGQPLRDWWRGALGSLGVSGFMWHGLRGGGTTDYWLRNQNLPALRRRGRWANEKTVERYVQEAVFVTCAAVISPQVRQTLRRLSELAGSIFSDWPALCLPVEEVEGRPTEQPDPSDSDDTSGSEEARQV